MTVLKKEASILLAKLNEHITLVSFWKVFFNAFELIVFIRHLLLYVPITCFWDIHQRFIFMVIEKGFYAAMRKSQCRHFYINKKVLIFFKNGKLFYVIFKSCPSLLKSPEFRLLSHSLQNFNETTSSDQNHILHPSPLPNFLAFHCSYLKSSIYTYFPHLSKLRQICYHCLLFKLLHHFELLNTQCEKHLCVKYVTSHACTFCFCHEKD